jgi:hypothetical protein
VRLLYVPLRPDELARLKEVAQEQRRRPQDQAAVLLAAALGASQTATDNRGQPSGGLPAEQAPRDVALAEAGAR